MSSWVEFAIFKNVLTKHALFLASKRLNFHSWSYWLFQYRFKIYYRETCNNPRVLGVFSYAVLIGHGNQITQPPPGFYLVIRLSLALKLCRKTPQAPSFGGGFVIPITLPYLTIISLLKFNMSRIQIENYVKELDRAQFI